MDGDSAPLQELVETCTKHDAALIVDEAHAVGIFGQGKGLVAELNLQDDVFARIVTFGKAFGCHGAAVLGNKLLKDYLINFSRAFIYTTALPLHSVLTIRKAHSFLTENITRIEKVKSLIEYFRTQISTLQIEVIDSTSPIQCLVIPGNDEVKKLAQNIQDKGFDVRPILSPTVPKGQERLRVCIHSFNTTEQIDKLITTLT